jgi:excinuclease UvrABC nuclease subunit
MRTIPAEAGIYELSASAQVSYPLGSSQVIYIGASKNLRRRIASYGSGEIKNRRISDFAHSDNLSVRFQLTNRHLEVEKELLKAFKRHYGKPPRGNAKGGSE